MQHSWERLWNLQESGACKSLQILGRKLPRNFPRKKKIKQKAYHCIRTSAFPFIMISIFIRLTSIYFLLSVEGGLNLVYRKISMTDTALFIISLWYQYYPMFTLGKNLVGHSWLFAKDNVALMQSYWSEFLFWPCCFTAHFFSFADKLCIAGSRGVIYTHVHGRKTPLG